MKNKQQKPIIEIIRWLLLAKKKTHKIADQRRYNCWIAHSHTCIQRMHIDNNSHSYGRSAGDNDDNDMSQSICLVRSAHLFSLIRITHSHLTAAKVYRISYRSHIFDSNGVC